MLRIIAITAGILVLGSGAFVAQLLLRRRQSAGALRLARTLHLNARWWKEQREKPGDLVYVALGDSAAQGVGASRPGRSYVGMIATHLRARTGRSVRVINLSVSGARLSDAIRVQLPALIEAQADLRPELVTVAIGANDIGTFDAERFERELGTVYAALPAGSIVSEVPAFYYGNAERRARAANAIVHRLAREHGFEVAPLHARTRRQGGLRYAFNQVAADFFHPNDRGYRVWASAFLPLLDRRFPARDSPIGRD